jgi:hypothetical protein
VFKFIEDIRFHNWLCKQKRAAAMEVEGLIARRDLARYADRLNRGWDWWLERAMNSDCRCRAPLSNFEKLRKVLSFHDTVESYPSAMRNGKGEPQTAQVWIGQHLLCLLETTRETDGFGGDRRTGMAFLGKAGGSGKSTMAVML